MLKRILLLLTLFAAYPAAAQTVGIVNGATPIIGGSTGNCVTKASNGTVSMAACGGAPSGTAGGDLSGTYPNPTVKASVALTTPSLTNPTVTTGTFTTPALTTPVIGSSVWASVPSAGTAGRLIRASNFGINGALLLDDGVRWRPVSGCVTLNTLTTVSSNIANSETVVFQYQIPANVVQQYDRLRLWFTFTKSGTTDTGLVKVRMGTAGTTSDTQIFAATPLAAANRAGGWVLDFKLISATTIQQLASSNTGAVIGYAQVGNPAIPAAVTITSAVANALYFNLTIAASSTNDTVALQDAHLQYCAAGT